MAAILASNGSELDSETKAGYTPLHVACHFGSLSMVRFLLLDHQVKIDEHIVSLPALILRISENFICV